MGKKSWTAGEKVYAADLNENFTGIKFGGDGSDGALAISSGTTTIDLGGEAVVVKQYSSISITGTGKLAFSNPNTNGTTIILKSAGDVTLTSSQAPMIDASGMGAAGGAGGAGNEASSYPVTATAGSNGTTAVGILDDSAHAGYGGDYGEVNSSPAPIGGAATSSVGAIYTNLYMYARTVQAIMHNMMNVAPGSGGGGGGGGCSVYAAGSTDGSAGGNGGNGGGGLIIECFGALNFTTAGGISVAGQNGADAADASGTYGAAGGGGGGGGAAGFCLILYNELTAASGTIVCAGGAGGAGGDATAGDSVASTTYNGSGAGGSGAGADGGAGGAGAAGVGSTSSSNGNTGSNAGGRRAGGGGGGGAVRIRNVANGTNTGGAGGTGGASENVLITKNYYF